MDFSNIFEGILPELIVKITLFLAFFLYHLVAVSFGPSDNLFQHHLIFGESTGFVREDVLDHPQLLVDWGSKCLRADEAKLWIVPCHQLIISNKSTLPELHNFYWNQQGDWNHSVEQNEIGAGSYNSLHYWRFLFLLEDDEYERLSHDSAVVQEHLEKTAKQDEWELKAKDKNHIEIYFSLEFTHLILTSCAVHHRLRELPHVRNHPNGFLRVSQHALSV